jgi:hypothetical protein
VYKRQIDTVKPKLANGNDNKEWTLYDKNGTTDIAGPTLPDGSTPTASSTGCYIIKTENIYAALPSNQLLRPWDNVPKKAQAQDFTANRLVYGNYTQNLSLGSYDNKFTLRPEERDFAGETISFEKGQPSIKSQRTYQSGVVFGDEYGRETPVFTGGKNSSTKMIYDRSPDSATFNGNASKSNRFYFKNLTGIDAKANWDNDNSLEPYYFKVFIKETASEYYNLVMDRVYRAEEDGNLWISFPSSDRNKLQEDDYIVLKKALESDAQVGIENKFKVIDIKNEAPEFIRKKYQEIGQADGDGTLSDLYANGTLQPYAGSSKILLSKESLIDENINDLQSIFDKGEKISITFSKTSSSSEEIYSKRYHIISLTTTVSSPEFYNITFDKNIVQQDSWVESSAGVLEPTLKTNIWKESTQEWEEFQGRFFVKIISDIVTDQYLEPQIGTSVQSNMVARAELFYLGDSALLAYNDKQHSTKYNANTNTTYDLSNATDRVTDNLKFGESATTSNWFIDSVYTVSQQPTIKANTSTDSGSLGSDGWSYNSDYGSLSPEMGSLDVSTSGNLFSGGSRFGGEVDGVEGIIVTSDKFHSTGARMWRKQPGGSYANDGDPDVYGSTNGKFYMHLSFSGVGTDLMDGVAELEVSAQLSGSNIKPGGVDLGSIINYNQQDPTNVGSQETLDYTQSNTITNVDASANQWDPLYNHPENEDIIKNLTTGSKFKFNNDTNNTLFTIRSVTVKRLYNYVSWNRYNVVNPGDDTAVIEGVSSVNFAYQAFVDSWTSSTSGWGDETKWREVEDMVRDFAAPINRRVCYILELDKNPIDECSVNPETLVNDVSTFLNFQQNYVSENSTVLSDNPAVWETEPKDNVDLDIYYEASNAIPIRLDINSASSTSLGYDAPDNRKGHMIAPIGSAVRCSKAGSHASTPKYKDCVVESWDGNIITLNPGLNVVTDFEIPDSSGILPSEAGYTTTYAATDVAGQTLAFSPETLKLYRDDLSYVEVGIYNVPTGGITGGGLITKFALDRTVNQKIGLPYFNCFSFGNGVESNRIRDDFNKPFISNGVKASSTLQEQYLEDHRSSGLIYSGLYSKNSSLNSLNQFIMAEKITKDLLPTYGSIQKLFARDSDLIALCEDKIVQIFADKDALFNADGNPQLVATNKVLGQSRPFVGEYGISKNPESFASSSYRAYFTDKQRGAVLRLSMDGLTPISDAGMHDWFADKMKGSYSDGKIIGSYDTNKDNYNLTFDYGVSENSGSYSFDADADFKSTTTDVTVTYKEDVKGWVSFKSFIPESGLSAVDTYFTFRNGKLYRHDDETRNTFYGDKKDSFITAIFNDSPTTIKHFNTLSYDGMDGWTCDKIITDIEESTIDQFINKENKYFATIIGDDTADDTSSFNFQGIGIAESIN